MTTTGKIGFGCGDETFLRELISRLPDGESRYLQMKLEDVSPISLGIPAELWPAGRVFCQEAEVRWEKNRKDFSILFLTEDDKFSSEDGLEWDNLYQIEDATFLLWGEEKISSKGENYWIETRIPKILKYPVEESENKTRVGINGLNYLKKEIVQFTRFKEVMRNVPEQT